jgi:malonate-semialdehyde dehydrogenase (acetylating)/methylmalonate-semialdehyde dehydrogenase
MHLAINFPAIILLWMFPMAVTCGNKFILKPLTQKDTGVALLLVELATKAGLPPRVLNIMHGRHKAVNVIYSILI